MNYKMHCAPFGCRAGFKHAIAARRQAVQTLRPETERALAEKAKSRGAALIECPVGGTVAPAKDGKLFGFVGGDAVALPIRRARRARRKN